MAYIEKDVNINFRVSRELRDAMKQRAEQLNINVSQFFLDKFFFFIVHGTDIVFFFHKSDSEVIQSRFYLSKISLAFFILLDNLAPMLLSLFVVIDTDEQNFTSIILQCFTVMLVLNLLDCSFRILIPF